MFRLLKLLFIILFRLTPNPPIPDDPMTTIQQLLHAHNKERISRGIGALYLHNQLLHAATYHATWMADNGVLSHTGNNESSVETRISDTGYIAIAMGENIAYGYADTKSVMNGWMHSRGHKSNILQQQYTDCGFAVVGKYWCAVFGTPTIQALCPEPLVSD